MKSAFVKPDSDHLTYIRSSLCTDGEHADKTRIGNNVVDSLHKFQKLFSVPGSFLRSRARKKASNNILRQTLYLLGNENFSSVSRNGELSRPANEQSKGVGES